MSSTATRRRGRGPGRLDPTVRGLLRTFLSPTVADRYASALQPIAVADRDAALAGAISTLRARFFVLPEELAVALVEHAGWSVADTSTMLGLPMMEVRAALRDAAGEAAPRVGAVPPPADEVDDEAAAVEAMLAGLPTGRRDAAAAAEEGQEEPVDTELSTSLPVGRALPSLQERARRADRVQRVAVNSTVVGILLLAGFALNATRPADEVTLPPDDDTVAVEPSPTPQASPPTAPQEPTTSPSPEVEVPVGPPELAAARFVASVDPVTGRPGPRLEEATTGDDPRLWLRFEQMPADELLLELTFTAPSGRTTVRPVLVDDRIPLVSVRLPDELGRRPGRYAARIDAEGMQPEVVELELTATDDQ